MAYFCHQCRRFVNVRVSPDLHCTNCNSEFVEELDSLNDSIDDANDTVQNVGGEDGSPVETGGDGGGPMRVGPNGIFIVRRQPVNGADDSDLVVVQGRNPFMSMLHSNSPFQQMFSQVLRQPNVSTSTVPGHNAGSSFSLASGAGTGFHPYSNAVPSGTRTRSNSTGGNTGSGSGHTASPGGTGTGGGVGGGEIIAFINQLLSNLVENASGTTESGRTPSITRLTFQFSPHSMPFNVNVNDYAWGVDGVDTIVTQLLNQFDSGPVQNVSAADLTRLPTTKVTQQHVDNGTQCATCMDTFALDESVACLDCQHIFHRPCIEPWLQRQNTCPICRKVVDPKTWGDGGDSKGNNETLSNPRPSTSSEFIDVDELD